MLQNSAFKFPSLGCLRHFALYLGYHKQCPVFFTSELIHDVLWILRFIFFQLFCVFHPLLEIWTMALYVEFPVPCPCFQVSVFHSMVLVYITLFSLFQGGMFIPIVLKWSPFFLFLFIDKCLLQPSPSPSTFNYLLWEIANCFFFSIYLVRQPPSWVSFS